jgi:hypothetical protein
MNLLRCQRRTSIPITWDQADMLVKSPEWKKKIEEAVSPGNPNLVDDIEETTVN